MFQHGGGLHDVLLVNWSNVDARILMTQERIICVNSLPCLLLIPPLAARNLS